jgi:SAM-dependent methyltransferase
MASPEPFPPAPPAVTGASRARWDELLCGIAGLLPDGGPAVLVDGEGPQPTVLAGLLAARVPTATIRCSDGHRRRVGEHWDVVIWVRTSPAGRGGLRPDGETGAGIVVDMHDPDWPVIRGVAAPLAGRGQWYLAETRAFFAVRAATWDAKFGDDLPAYGAAVARAGIPRGGTVVDVGCGTGRALPALRQAVGPHGTVVAIDITPEMLGEARGTGRAKHAALLLADARRLPLADALADAVFAAGLVSHLPDTEAGLGELARITRPGGLLVLFHPSGRAALAARHGRVLRPDEPLAAEPLERLTKATGWRLTSYDDAVDRFFALAVRD